MKKNMHLYAFLQNYESFARSARPTAEPDLTLNKKIRVLRPLII